MVKALYFLWLGCFFLCLILPKAGVPEAQSPRPVQSTYTKPEPRQPTWYFNGLGEYPTVTLIDASGNKTVKPSGQRLPQGGINFRPSNLTN